MGRLTSLWVCLSNNLLPVPPIPKSIRESMKEIWHKRDRARHICRLTSSLKWLIRVIIVGENHKRVFPFSCKSFSKHLLALITGWFDLFCPHVAPTSILFRPVSKGIHDIFLAVSNISSVFGKFFTKITYGNNG